MAFILKQLWRRRRCQMCCVRFTLVSAFSFWLLCIFNGFYYNTDSGLEDFHIEQSNREDKLEILHSRQISPYPGLVNNSRFAELDGEFVHSSASTTDFNLLKFIVKDGRKFDHVGEELSQKSSKSRNSLHVKEVLGQIGDRYSGGLKESLNGAANETKGYEEFDWWSQTESDRMPLEPGGRFDKPRLGEHGRPVTIDASGMNHAERSLFQKGWDTHKYNEMISQMISVQRDVPDFRSNQCKDEFESDVKRVNLPKASIIICFYNEAWSVLQRTVYSVLLRTPAHLIGEIILVDDYSELEELKEPLEHFVSAIDKLRLLRMTNRSGLVKARLAGVEASEGPVIVFLDSHVECGEGWLQPLLETLEKHPRVAATPQIDVISDKTFSINQANDQIGILEFKSFAFNWGSVLPRIKKTIKSPTEAFESPTLAGGLLAIRKEYFISLGTYDPHLVLWGGENIELSLKLWQCGGGILTHPCSRVAHVFRDTSPYLTGRLVDVAVINSARVAYVWSDEFKKFYFKNKNFKRDAWKAITKDIKKQFGLRRRLGCKPFRWFLNHVYPELYIEGSGKFFGPIQSWNGLCLHDNDEGSLVLAGCNHAIPWEMSRTKEIRHQKRCLESKPSSDVTYSKTCHSQLESQTFEYRIQDGTIYHPGTDRCLTVGSDGRNVYLRLCQVSSVDQIWQWPPNKDYIP